MPIRFATHASSTPWPMGANCHSSVQRPEAQHFDSAQLSTISNTSPEASSDIIRPAEHSLFLSSLSAQFTFSFVYSASCFHLGSPSLSRCSTQLPSTLSSTPDSPGTRILFPSLFSLISGFSCSLQDQKVGNNLSGTRSLVS